MASDNNVTYIFREPKPTLPDYIQMFYLSTIFVIGVPFNIYTFVKLCRQYRLSKSRILLLSIHLNLADLMILFFFALAKVAWLITYGWIAGTMMCKIMKFLQTMSFTLSSNIIVCIGLDRLLSLMQPLQIRVTANIRCKRILSVAWLLALVCSLPQLYTWMVFLATPTWGQCVDVWSYWSYHNISHFDEDHFGKNLYNGFHLITIFWLPIAVILICYSIMLKIIYKNLGSDVSTPLLHSQSVINKLPPISRTSSTACPPYNRSPTVNHSPSKVSDYDYSDSINGLSPSPPQVKRQSHIGLRRNGGQSKIKRTKYKTLRISLFIVLAYLICWLPYNVAALLGWLNYEAYSTIKDYVYCLHGLMVVNVLINPLIYSNYPIFSKSRKTCSV